MPSLSRMADLNKLYTENQKRIETTVEKVMRTLFFWEKDEKRLGGIIRFCHYTFVFTMLFFYIMLHTFLPSYGGFIIFYVIFALIWIHHLICGGCVWTTIERRMIGDERGFLDPLLEIFHIPTTPDVSCGIFMMVTCGAMTVVTLELILLTILNWNHLWA